VASPFFYDVVGSCLGDNFSHTHPSLLRASMVVACHTAGSSLNEAAQTLLRLPLKPGN
jgi:hypothetical protein